MQNSPKETQRNRISKFLSATKKNLFDKKYLSAEKLAFSSIKNLSREDLEIEFLRLRCESGGWRSKHARAIKREEKLKKEVTELKAKLKLREHQLFGQKSEKKTKSEKNSSNDETKKKPRGQQPKSKGHGRKDNSHLPVREDFKDIPVDQCICEKCGCRRKRIGTEDSEMIEIEVKAYRRKVRRWKYGLNCDCEGVPGVITAPPPSKLIPKSIYGLSVWETILLDKFLFLRPTYRLLADLKSQGLNLAQGTLTDGLKKIAPIFDSVYQAIVLKNQQDDRWHADETRWHVFIAVEGKVNYIWYMWIYKSATTVVYEVAQSRSAEVPKRHFKKVKKGMRILVVDRYAAYKAMAKIKDYCILLAFCWAHVRRDFLGVAKGWSEHDPWAMQWVENIGNLYYLNNRRLAVLEKNKQEFIKRDQELRTAVNEMEEKRKSELSAEQIAPCRVKVLESLKNHWEGLTIFVDYPEVPMDNNSAEQSARIAAVARKNFYGSGSLWSGELTAKLFSIFQTLELWKINPRLWLREYLQICAANKGKAPENIGTFLPWNMSKERQEILSYPFGPKIKDSS